MVLNYSLTEENAIQLLTLSGELIDKNQAVEMLIAVDAILELGKNKFIVDLGELKYMNSSGLNVLIQLLTKTRNKGGESVLFNVNKKVNELFIITKLNTLFKVVASKQEALDKIV
jgi:anti-sigma B factor antagonist